MLIGARAHGRAGEAAGRLRQPRPARTRTFNGRRRDARRRRATRRSCSTRSTRSASRPARRRSRRCAAARRSARWSSPPTRPSGCRARSPSTAAAAHGRGLLQRRGPGQAPLRRVDDPLAAGRGQRRALGRRAHAGGRATSTSWSRAGSSRSRSSATSTSSACATPATIIDAALARLPQDAPQRARSSRCALRPPGRREPRRLASRSWPRSAQPVRVKQTSSTARSTPLDTFAVAVAVTRLADVRHAAAGRRAAGARARGARVRAGWCAGSCRARRCSRRRSASRRCCAFVVTLVMLAGSAPSSASTGAARRCGCSRWRPARSRFAALGVAIGALAREVRAASLLAFLLVAAARVPRARARPARSRAASTTSSTRDLGRCSRSSRRCDALDAAINGASRSGPAAAPAAWRAVFGALARVACGASRRSAGAS